mmetsp:Transcript_11744/g.19961  ORF Transcript_11744/g.19961 Transcript_11744/m.19961 type:complete len:122 (-) Transcript_11744:209-574(-)
MCTQSDVNTAVVKVKRTSITLKLFLFYFGTCISAPVVTPQLYLELAALILTTDGLTFFLCGAGPRMVRINSNTWLRMNADEDTYKDPMLAGGSSGETTTMKRINSHTQLFTREAGTEKKRE